MSHAELIRLETFRALPVDVQRAVCRLAEDMTNTTGCDETAAILEVAADLATWCAK